MSANARVSNSPAALRHALGERVVVADGAMGTMLQAQDPSLDDFEGHEGCNEILNVTRPDIVRAVHEAYFDVGVDAVETNTFGANLAQPRRVRHREPDRGARRGRRPDRPRGRRRAHAPRDQPRWVIGSVGPGTKLPTLGHVPYATLRDAYETQVRGMLAGGVHAVLVETAQDLLQAKAAVIGAKRALTAAGSDAAADVPGHRRDDRHDAARHRDRRRARPRSSRSAST